MAQEEDEYVLKTIKFDLNTDDPKCLVFRVKSDSELNSDDLMNALEQLLELLKKDKKSAKGPSGH